jgi:S1-C subfamily serine protease
MKLLAVLLTGAALLAGCSSGDKKSDSKTPSGPVAEPANSVEAQLIAVVKDVSPKVVQIQTPQGLGSGVVYDDHGDIVTNAHVVGQEKTFSVTLSSGHQHDATLVGSYPGGDLAVIKLTDAQPAPATFADSKTVQVGELALAIGNPLGLRSSVTQGIVSSVGRTVPEGNGAVLTSAVQTSAPINPGNSGGALVDIRGRVIGIPTLAALEQSGAQAPGIGFAISSNNARLFADQLIDTGHVTPQGGFLGVTVATVIGGGVRVASVQPGGPAAKAGIRPGDVIVSVDGQPTPTTVELQTVLATLKQGQTVDVDVVRQDGSKATLKVTLGKPPATGG